MYFIIGLGNPGVRYARTRHNIGWLVIAELARRHHVDLSRKAHDSQLGGTLLGDQRVTLAKPLTFMNLSGRAVGSLLRYHNAEAERLLVVCDDLNLPLGRLRLRRGGSDGGHNGLKSISQALSTTEYPRLRIGIGEPARTERVERGTADYVLSVFAPDEMSLVEDTVTRAADCVEAFVNAGIEAAMNTFNQVQ